MRATAGGLSPTGRGAPKRGMCLPLPRAGCELYARDIQRGPRRARPCPRRPSRPIPSTVEAPNRHGSLGVRASGGANSTNLTALPSAAAGDSWSDAPVSLLDTLPPSTPHPPVRNVCVGAPSQNKNKDPVSRDHGSACRRMLAGFRTGGRSGGKRLSWEVRSSTRRSSVQ